MRFIQIFFISAFVASSILSKSIEVSPNFEDAFRKLANLESKILAGQDCTSYNGKIITCFMNYFEQFAKGEGSKMTNGGTQLVGLKDLWQFVNDSVIHGDFKNDKTYWSTFEKCYQQVPASCLYLSNLVSANLVAPGSKDAINSSINAAGYEVFLTFGEYIFDNYVGSSPIQSIEQCIIGHWTSYTRCLNIKLGLDVCKDATTAMTCLLDTYGDTCDDKNDLDYINTLCGYIPILIERLASTDKCTTWLKQMCADLQKGGFTDGWKPTSSVSARVQTTQTPDNTTHGHGGASSVVFSLSTLILSALLYSFN